MTTRQARRERREAERKQKKAEFKRLKAAGQEPISASADSQLEPEFSPEFTVPADSARARLYARIGFPPTGFVSQTAAPSAKRAEINRQNAQHSTGPRTPTGKLASSRNSLKHGLASGEMIIPGEDQAALEALRHDLLEEYRPANPTEELLVTEMAQSWWLTQRAIRFQNQCFTENGGVDEKRLALFLRYQTTHDRAFYKALNTLIRLKQSRAREQAVGFVSQRAPAATPDSGFASQNPRTTPDTTQFVRQNRAGDALNHASEAA